VLEMHIPDQISYLRPVRGDSNKRAHQLWHGLKHVTREEARRVQLGLPG
jgi:hypothetical protein